MTEQKSNLYIPGAIILAGFLVAMGIYLANKSNSPTKTNDQQVAVKSTNVDPVTSSDHILGNPSANITVIEYSDTECPFCKMFNTTMDTVMNTYGKDGKVAWVYRHFPLDAIHSKTRKEAEATECANELGGNSAFWNYLGLIYTNTPSNNGLDPAKLPTFAKTAGLDVTKFNACLASGKYANVVQADYLSGIKLGVQGTPFSAIVLKKALTEDQANTIANFVVQNQLSGYMTISNDKKEVDLNGALPLEAVEEVLNTVSK